MGVREKVLEFLEVNKGRYVSGAEIAGKLSVSRNSVWKAVKNLEKEGYDIHSVTGSGYMLSKETDILSVQSIKKYLGEDGNVFDLDVKKTVTSTNDALKGLAVSGAREGKVIISEMQTKGKGRLGRSFFSPEKTGIYMSLLLRPKIPASQSLLITAAAAVAVAEALEEVSGRKTGIKWVNDVYSDGKKVCGILAEASFGMESGGLEFAVLGIGINVESPVAGFPEEIKDKAAAVFEDGGADVRSRLISEVLKRFWDYYIRLPEKGFLEAYKKRSILTGKKVEVITGGMAENAVALDIDDECRLIVKMQDGRICPLNSGEVSIRI